MNRHCHRIVFNAARGQLMAVAETAQRCGKSASGESPSGAAAAHSPALLHPVRQTALAALVALGAMLASAPVALAQIIADPTAPANQRPTVLSDSAGRPLVNIQTPSAAGLSRNTYRQFDVPTGGIVLNNAASNPWLANGVLAKTILNEVNSTSPSYLNGAITVNGGSAQVIVANPNGIQVNGGSFSNASRATLTTGTAQVSNGALTGFDVRGGTVTIGAGGLNNSATPYTDILSQAVSVVGKLQAQSVGITTGKQTVAYDTGLISNQDTAAATGVATYAIDTGALGGMYANNISILATESGLGVRNQGTWQASGGQIVVTADGLLRNQGAVSANVASLATVSGDIENVGNIQGGQAVLLSSGRDVRLSGAGLTQTEGSAVVISAQKGISVDSNASISSTATGGQVTLSARETVQLSTGSTVAGQAGVTIVSDTQVQATGTQLSSSNGSVNLLAGSGLSLTGSRINAKSIQIETGKALAETNAAITLNSNNLNATGALTVLATGALSTSSNVLSAGTHLHMGSAGALSSQSDRLRASSIELIGSSVTANSLDAAASTGYLKITSSAGSVEISGTYDQPSKLAAGTDLNITALGGDARLTAVQATADHIRVNSTGNTELLSAQKPLWGKFTTELKTSLTARKSLLVSTVGTGKSLSLGNANLDARTEDLSLVSAGDLSLGTARVIATEGSVSAISAGAISGIGQAYLRAGQNLGIDAGQGNLVILPGTTSSLLFGQDLSITARTGLLKLDAYEASRVDWAGRDIHLQGTAVDILGAKLSASRDLHITSTAGDINFFSLTRNVNVSGYASTYVQGAELSAGRNLQVISAANINGQGLKATAGADLLMRAVGSLKLTGTANRLTSYDGFWTTQQRLVNPSELSAGGAMALSAGTDLLMDAVNARAGGTLAITALGNVRLDASQNWRESRGTSVDSGKWSTTVTHHLRESFTTAPTQLTGASVSVSAGNDLSTYGTRITSTGRVDLQAGGAANYYAVYDQTTSRDDSSRSDSFFGIQYSSSSSSSSRVETAPLVTRVQTESQLVSSSGGDTLLQGTQVRAAGGYAFKAGVGEKARADARIILEGVITTVQQSRTSKSDAVVWQSMSGSGSSTETLALPTFAGGGTFSAPGGLSVQIPDGDFKTQIATLSAQPGMGYLNDLTARTDVNWQPVKLAHEQWSYSQEGLTPAGAALLSVAVAWATGGMGASMLGTTGTATSAMANAAFTSLAAQASITLINNKGDIAKTLKDMSSSSTVKATLAAVITAGVLDKLGSTSTMSELSKSGGFSDKLTYNLINATGRALTNTAINGGNLEDTLKAALVGGLVDTAQGEAASVIKGLESQYLAHKLAHALAGCVAGAAAGGACKDGAIGAAIGEVVVGMFEGQKPGPAATQEQINAYTQKVLAYSKLVAGAVTAYAGGNAQTAITTAETAVRNNGLLELLFPRVLPKKIFSGGDLSNQIVDKVATIDTERQRITLIQPGERDLYAAGTGGVQVDGYTVIFAHASQSSIQGVSPTKTPAEWNEFVDMIKTSGAWKPGQPIILDACSTGMVDDGVASALAKSLNVRVIGASTTTWNIPSYSTSGLTGSYDKATINVVGKTFEIPNLTSPGIWKTYSSNGDLIKTATTRPY